MLYTRGDAVPADGVPAYRRVMPAMMPTRNGAAAFFDLPVRLDRTLPFLEGFNAGHPDGRATLFHVVLHAAVHALDERPRLNRFVAGGRLWQRDGIWISYTAKTALDDDGDLTAVQLRVLLALPHSLRRAAFVAVNRLDALRMLPGSWIENDPFYASMFVTNLGSVGLDAVFHHLYDYGNIPIFCATGRARDEGHGPVAHLRFTYDERVEDRFYAARALDLLRGYVEDPVAA